MALLNRNDNYTYYDSGFELSNRHSSFDVIATNVANALYLYFTPTLILLGSIGNLVSVYVFCDCKLRLQSTSQYLSALAISDTIFLLQLIPPWLSAQQFTELFYRGGFCQVFVYLSYVTCCSSAWLVVAFTIERFVAVLYPLRRNAWCTVRRARHVIIGLSVAALVMNLPVLRFAAPFKNDCNLDRSYLEQAARFNLVDTIISFTIPLSLIVVLNVWIIFGVCRLEQTRTQLMKAEQPASVDGSRTSRLVGCPRSQQRVTRMLLIVSSVFVVLNLPAYALRVLAYMYDLMGIDTWAHGVQPSTIVWSTTSSPDPKQGSGHSAGRWMALQLIAVSFFHTNFGINFMLYCLSGQNFRQAVLQSIPYLRQRVRRRVDIDRRATSRPARASSISSMSIVSFLSNTEATTQLPTTRPTTTPAMPVRRKKQEPFITRWKFDNSRQRGRNATQLRSGLADVAANDIEMTVFQTHNNSI